MILKKTLLPFTASLALASGAVIAAGPSAMSSFDLDGDKKVTEEEAAGAIENFDEFDKNGDGALDKTEFEAAYGDTQKKAPEKGSDAGKGQGTY